MHGLKKPNSLQLEQGGTDYVVDLLQHFFASVDKAKSVLGLKPEFDLVEGLADSYNLDFGRGTFRKEADFSTDDIILGKSLVLQS